MTATSRRLLLLLIVTGVLLGLALPTVLPWTGVRLP